MVIFRQPGNEPVREVVLHCAAIKTSQFDGFTPFQAYSTINRWHVERGFKGFGYHALIMPTGEVYAGRRLDDQGAHVAGHNKTTLGLLLIESSEIKRLGLYEDYFTSQQRIAARAWIKAVPGIQRVTGHNDYESKLCPGFKVQTDEWL